MGFGDYYKKQVVQTVMKVKEFDDKQMVDGAIKVVKFQSCLYSRPTNKCKKNGQPILWPARDGYTNFFSHLVNAMFAILHF